MQNLQPLLVHWKVGERYAYQTLYALYFGAVVRQFIAAVQLAYECKGDEEYAHVRLQAEQHHVLLTTLHKFLVDSDYERRYALQLARYQELLALLPEQ